MSESEPELPTTPPRWQRRPDSRPEEILDAAVRVFGDCGFAGAKLEDVAREAGVSKGTLYLYFDSKEALFREMVRVKVAVAVARAAQVAQTEGITATDMLHRFLIGAWDMVRDPIMIKISRLIHSEIMTNFPDLARFYFDTAILPTRKLLAQIVDRGVASGEFRPIAHDFALRGVMSLLVHSAVYQRVFGPYDPAALNDDQVLEGIISLTIDGMRVPPSHSSPGKGSRP